MAKNPSNWSLAARTKLSILLVLLIASVTSASLPSNDNATSDTKASEELSDNGGDVTVTEARLGSNRSPAALLGKSLKLAVDNIRPLLEAASESRSHHHGDTGDAEDKHDDDYDVDDSSDEPFEESIPLVATSTTRDANETIDILKMWSRLTTEGVEAIFKEVTPLFVQLSYDIQISNECASSFLKLFNGLRKQELWAFRVVDSYGRLTPGFLDGTVSDFGEFDECLDVTFPEEDQFSTEQKPNSQPSVVGKYCMLRLNVPLPPRPAKVKVSEPIVSFANHPDLKGTILDSMAARINQLYNLKGFRFGACIPSTCTALEIEAVVNKIVFPVLRTNVTLGPDQTCDTRLDKYDFNRTQLVAISVLVLVVTLVTIGTVFDIGLHLFADRETSKAKGSKVSKLMLAFSMPRNTAKLFHINEEREEVLSAIHGMRVLSMFWIIIGHTYCFGGFYKVLYTFRRLAVDSISNPSRWAYQPLINTFLLVESFFFLGGVVLIYVALPMLEKQRGKFNYFVYVVHRWSRLTPALIGVICFIIIMPALGTGPIWKHEMNWQSEGCQKNWWLSLLFLNNWIQPVDEMCGGQTWFIAADFQIYLFAPIIFLAYFRSAALGVAVNLAFLFGGMASSGISAYVYSAEPTYILDHIIDLEMLHDYSKIGYFPTYHHIAPYCLGTLVGYLILKYRENRPKIPGSVLMLTWVAAPFASLFVMFCTQGWNDAHNKKDPTMGVTIIFSILQRITWCLGVAWVTLVCATGYGGPVNKILSWSGFIPLSRLSYSIYMVHLIPIFLRVNSIRYTRAWDDFSFMSWAFFNILLGVLGAYLLYIFFESPINSLERILLRPKAGRSSERPETARPDGSTLDAQRRTLDTPNHQQLEARYRKRTDDCSVSHLDSESGRDDASADIKVDISSDTGSDSGHSSTLKSVSDDFSTSRC